MTQQARNFLVTLDERTRAARFLLDDRDAMFNRSFDDVVRSERLKGFCSSQPSGVRLVLRTVEHAKAAARWRRRLFDEARMSLSSTSRLSFLRKRSKLQGRCGGQANV